MKPAAIGGLCAVLAAVTGLPGAFVFLDRHMSYRPPLAGSEAIAVPRVQAVEDLARWRREKQKEAERLATLLASLDTEKMVQLGSEIVKEKGLCMNCHRIDGQGSGTQGPDLGGVGARAGSRVPGLSDVEYLAQSLYRPRAFVVEGFSPTMVPVNEPPIGLSDLEILMVVAYLQSLGGTPTVTPETVLPFGPGADGGGR
ncbi:MAG: c-type cytochrome [Acidobacteriota bacterium]